MNRLLTFITSLIIILHVFTPLSASAEAQKRLNMTYLFASSASNPIKYIDMTNNSLDQVSPRYFQILNNGKMDVQVPANTNAFVEEMHRRNIEVVPFLANNWANGELMFSNSETITDQIVKTIKDHNFDGINIDVEGLGPAYRDQFTDFIRILDRKLPKEKTLSIAVAPNPWGTNKGWQGFYDYKELSNYADYLFIMTYDERGGGSKNYGPVASSAFIEKSIQYAIKHVTPEKVVLGIPFYGRVWNLDDVKDTNSTNTNRVLGESISLSKIDSLLETYDVKMEYNKATESVKGTFEIKAGDPEFQLKTWQPALKPGQYEMWVENDESLKKKIEFVHKYNLKGVGSWSLGQEDPSIWKDFRLWLDGLDFIDVSIDHWALNSISYVKERQWMLGKNSTETFKPADSLTRAEAAAILTRVLNLSLKEEFQSPFADIGSTHQWARTNIEIVRQHGVMNGTSATMFAPGKALTREEMAAILDRLLGDQIQQNSYNKMMFKDQNDISDWAFNSVERMSGNNIFSGYENGTFLPKKQINRAEMAALLDRISKYF